MQSVKEIIPNGELSKFIESYRYENSANPVRLVPEGTFHVLFTMLPFSIQGMEKHELAPGFYLLPIHTGIQDITYQKGMSIIRCKAFVIQNINNAIFDYQCQDYWRFNPNHSCIRHFNQKLSKTIHKHDQILEQFVFDVLTNRFYLNENLREGVNYILEQKGCVSVQQMAKDLGVSRQGLHKFFMKNLRISPKQLAKIWQLNHFMDLADGDDSLTGAAIDAGYFDQSHCNREFKQIIGLAPRSFFAQNYHFTRLCIHNRFTHVYDPKI